METETPTSPAIKQGKRIGYFDHSLKCLVLNGDNFLQRKTWGEWRAFLKTHPGEGISEFLFRCIDELKADGHKKGSIKVPYERLRARLKLRKIGLSNNWTPYASRTMAYMAEFDRRYKDRHYDLLNFFSFELVNDD